MSVSGLAAFSFLVIVVVRFVKLSPSGARAETIVVVVAAGVVVLVMGVVFVVTAVVIEVGEEDKTSCGLLSKDVWHETVCGLGSGKTSKVESVAETLSENEPQDSNANTLTIED